MEQMAWSPYWGLKMLEVLGFVIGIHLTILLFASCYRVIDLWYCIGKHWLTVMARISIIAGTILIFYFLSPGAFQEGFYAGQVFFACFHVVIFWLGRLLVAYMRHFP